MNAGIIINLKNGINNLQKRVNLINIKRRFKKYIKNSPRKIVVGASGIFQDGWIPSDIEYFNILKPEDWQEYFIRSPIDAILAEHVWEHLTREEGVIAANFCYKYLKYNGYLRIAVPDGFNPSLEYINWVKPAGEGPGAQDHKILYNYKSLTEVLEIAGFHIDLLEYYDENGIFHYKEWSPDEGIIYRSMRFDERNDGSIVNYTSIIIDAKKPLKIINKM